MFRTGQQAEKFEALYWTITQLTVFSGLLSVPNSYRPHLVKMTVTSTDNLAIPQGARVLVSGANGFIASHVVKQLLRNGYKVRGTVRNLKSSSWLIALFESQYGKGFVELVEVPDMAAKGAFDEAVRGVSGFIHTATPVMQIQDPNIAVPTVVEGTKNALQSAVKAGIKRFVLTSSSTAASSPIPNKVFTMDEKTWNEVAVKNAWAPPPYDGVQRRLDVY
ncbi:unnamed protein product [Periconia digitata]|uniref:3-beta hydroxysteroid dehydrogenase/isomerase domain-containing protein n=1 Tax=Periconia digitata TaxID=1303443 RepID=A0A9W4UPA2_9PLEO|nr:unnamed protein product [Periconia digitata]